MTGATSNITTHWTFRDGRDYVLSLNTTETPNTIAFWVSDKVTGEEWTSCYDENAVELITKRTGCYKSFQTFLCMIKSAMLKKSDSVVIDLLNFEDLTAISVQRQNSSSGTSTPNSNFLSVPQSFHLYTGEPSSPFGGGIGGRPAKPPRPGDPNNRPPNGTMLNKRKYLIITYIAEFDQVHYPLPLNYSCPPDLNVMQNNIVKLKAEVTSLKSANKELANRIGLIRSSSTDTGFCTANNNAAGGLGLKISQDSNVTASTMTHTDAGCTAGISKTGIKSAPSTEIQSVFVRKTDLEKHNEATANNDITVNLKDKNPNHSDNGMDQNNNVNEIEQNGNFLNADATRPENSCTKCAVLIDSLQAKIRELQDCIGFQRDRHLESMEKLETENHFLRHKVEAAEKYEIELWTQIQHLKEKISQTEKTDRKKLSQLRGSGTQTQRTHLSRHDLFYNNSRLHPTVQSPTTRACRPSPSPAAGGSKGNRTNSKGRPVSTSRPFSSRGSNSKPEKTGVCRRNANESDRSRSNSSTASYRSVDARVNQNRGKDKTEARSRGKTVSRSPTVMKSVRSKSSSTASNGSTGFTHRVSSPSPTPSCRFDPTAYISEKRQKQSKIANLRLKKLEDRTRNGSTARIPGPSPGKRSAESSPLPTRRNQQRSLSAGNGYGNGNRSRTKVDTENLLSAINGVIGDSKSYRFTSLKSPFHGKTPSRSRSSSESGKTRIISTIRFPIPSTDPPNPRNSAKRSVTPTRRGNQSRNNPVTATMSPSTFVSELERHVFGKTRTKTSRRSRSPPPHRCRAPFTQTGTGLEFKNPYRVNNKDERLSHSSRRSNNADTSTVGQVQQSSDDLNDISLLQSKLAALQAFLETCKPNFNPLN